MRRHILTLSLMSGFTCFATSVFAQAGQVTPDTPRTEVEQALDSINPLDNTRNAVDNATRNAVDNTRNAADSTRANVENSQNNVQNSTQLGTNNDTQLRTQGQSRNQANPNRNTQRDQRVQGNAYGQQNQFNSGVQQPSNVSGQLGNPSTIQSNSGTVQSYSGDTQRSTYQNGTNYQGQGYQDQQWQNSGTYQNGQVNNSGNYNAGNYHTGGMQQAYFSPQSSNRVYVLRYDSYGREYICVNGQAVYFDNAKSHSAHGQSNAANSSQQHRAGYGSYDAYNGQQTNQLQNGQTNQLQNGQSNQLQNGQSVQGNLDTNAPSNPQNRNRTEMRGSDELNRGTTGNSGELRTGPATDSNRDLNLRTDNNLDVDASETKVAP